MLRDISKAIEECRESHAQCPNRSAQSPLPKRLVLVDGESTKFRIHESNHEEKGDYVALSYCWGKEALFNATTSNIDSLKEGLDVDILSQTLQDAIEMTRRLGYQYIWIDALCILQDSSSDKEVENAKMGSIYQGATLTIAAAVVSGAQEGFLNIPRACPRYLQVMFPLGRHGEDKICLFIKSDPADINLLPLGRRGWAFQEFFLSNRMVIYTKEQAGWFCRQTKTCPFNKSFVSYQDNILVLGDVRDGAKDLCITDIPRDIWYQRHSRPL